MKLKNNGNQIGFIYKGRTIDFQPGEVVEVEEGFLESINKAVANIEVYVEPVKEEPKVEAPKPKPKPKGPKKYTKDELFDMNKAEQVKLLGKYGVTGKDVPKLEKDRVKKILKLQE